VATKHGWLGQCEKDSQHLNVSKSGTSWQFAPECQHLQQYASMAESYMQEAVSPFSAAVCVYVRNVFSM
jgi:hypothetical protein